MNEIHLVILWSKALYKKEKILLDIKEKFQILDIYNVSWSKAKFSENLSRFYGENLPKNSGKEKHCGNDTFCCIIIRDMQANYDARETSKGYKVVNTNLFDAKQLYRGWTGGGHKIHATDNINETKLQLALLFSKSYDDYLKKPVTDIIEKNCDSNLVGFNGWSSFEELFHILNLTSNYVILRNFENLEEQLTSKHPDVDLLVENKSQIVSILNAKPTNNKSYRVQYNVVIKNKNINFDLRYIGDDYFSYKWEREILLTKVKHKYFYIPSNENHFFTLLYHALIHKNEISLDYIQRFQELKKDLPMNEYVDENLLDYLLNYMDNKSYQLVEAKDITVGFNKKNLDKRVIVNVSKERERHEYYINMKQAIKSLLKKIKKKVIK